MFRSSLYYVYQMHLLYYNLIWVSIYSDYVLFIFTCFIVKCLSKFFCTMTSEIVVYSDDLA